MTLRARAFCKLGFLAAGFGLAATALPLQLPTVCLFKRLTGCPCCGCGLTHAFCALARGDIVQAMSFHIASVPLAAVIAFAAALLAAEAICNRPFLGPVWKKVGRPVVWMGVVLLMAGWAINLQAHFAGHDPLPHALAFSTR